MTEAEQLSLLIGNIYDAALEPTRWPAVQEKLCRFVVGRACGLYWQDSVSKTGRTFYQSGVHPHYDRLYFDKYIAMDPISPSLLFYAVEEVLSVADVMPHDEFCATRFFKEWMEPQRLIDGVLCNLEKSATSSAVFIMLRHQDQGLVDEGMRRRTRLVVPHVRRAALIGKLIDRDRAETATLADTLDGLSVNVLLVKANGQIVHANASGHALLAHGQVLHATAGRLLATDPAASQVLKDAISAIGNGDAAVGNKGIAVPLRAHDGERYLAHVLPLTSGARRRASIAYAAVAAIFVHKAAFDAASPLETLARLYKLTPGELRVLVAVSDGGSVQDMAETLGIEKTTAKTHLRHLFQKTNTRRQADLIKLIATYSNPLIG